MLGIVKSMICSVLLLFVASAALAVAGPSGVPRSHDVRDAIGSPEECSRVGGSWKRQPVSEEAYFCELKTRDAGKACADTSDCEGYCVPDRDDMGIGAPVAGRCSVTVLLWCSSYVAKGRLAEACVD